MRNSTVYQPTAEPVEPDEVEDLLHRMSISEYNVTGGSVRKYQLPVEHYRLELRIPVASLKGRKGPRARIDPD